jgi:hypothetical protein
MGAPLVAREGSLTLDQVDRVAKEVSELLSHRIDGAVGACSDQFCFVLERHFDATTSESRDALTDALPAAFKAVLDDYEDDGWAEVTDDTGWVGDRFRVEPLGGPRVAFTDYCGFYILGGWVDESTFALIGVDTDARTAGGLASVDIRHWHPDSMTSGSYRDTIVVCSDTLAYVLEYEDEDGCYLTLLAVDVSNAENTASTLSRLVESLYLFGAEQWIVRLASFEPDFASSAGLFCAENSGYSIAECSIAAPAGVWDELHKRYGPPTPAEAQEWLSTIEQVVDLDFYTDLPFVVALRAVAGRKGSN